MCATAVKQSTAGAPDSAAPLPMPNLLNDVDALGGLLATSIRSARWLDAYLFAAGINQVAEDWLHDHGDNLRKAAGQVSDILPAPVASPVGAVLRAAHRGVQLQRRARASTRAAAGWQRRHAQSVELLAQVVAGTPPDAALEAAVLAGVSSIPKLPASLRRSLVRLPTCFHTLDQRPADIRLLTERFASGNDDRSRSIAVVGVRTSGSYTAPLHAAWLRQLGYESVLVLTYRPGRPWLRAESQALAGIAERGGLALLTDDPPNSGGSVLRTARALGALGFPADRIVLLLQLLSDRASAPAQLAPYPAVLLEWQEWDVRRSLSADELGRALSRMLGATVEVTAVGGPAPSSNPRAHARATVEVAVPGRGRKRYLVRGIGTGYFGGHAAAVAARLSDWTGRVLAIDEGLLYAEDGDAGGASAGEPITLDDADALAAYVDARALEFAVAEDFSLRLGLRGSVRKSALDLLACGFGHGERLARPLLFEAGRRLMVPGRPAVVDGQTGLENWKRSGAGVVKTRADEGTFSNRDLFCFDPAYDLAGVAASDGDRSGIGSAVRSAYERIAGEPVDAERWLLYQLVHIVDDCGPAPWTAAGERRLSLAVQRYYSEVFFANAPGPRHGPVCLVDVDGVIETRGLGFSALTPASAIALRALARHGYRVVPVTGRGCDEVLERCRSYGWPGGVAEYGGALCDASSGAVVELIGEDDRNLLAALRDELGRMPGVELDASHRLAVRASQVQGRGRRPLPDAEVTRLLADPRFPKLRAVRGERQTDFLTAGFDKGRAARAYIDRLDVPAPRPEVTLAVGDSAADIPVLRMARSAYAVGNADAEVRAAGIDVMRRPCQLGFRDAVGHVLGHRAGDCELCRLPPISKRTALLLEILSAPEMPGGRKLVPLARIAARLLGTA